jgi:hypothetical protein
MMRTCDKADEGCATFQKLTERAARAKRTTEKGRTAEQRFASEGRVRRRPPGRPEGRAGGADDPRVRLHQTGCGRGQAAADQSSRRGGWDAITSVWTATESECDRVMSFSIVTESQWDRVTSFSIVTESQWDRVTSFSIAIESPWDRVVSFSIAIESPWDRVVSFSIVIEGPRRAHLSMK